MLQLSQASNDLCHTIDLPIVSPVVFLAQPGPNFREETNFPENFGRGGGGGTNLPHGIRTCSNGRKSTVCISVKNASMKVWPW